MMVSLPLPNHNGKFSPAKMNAPALLPGAFALVGWQGEVCWRRFPSRLKKAPLSSIITTKLEE